MRRYTKGPKISREEFEKLPRVRVWNSVGPCLTYYRLFRKNEKTCTLVFWNGDKPTYERIYSFCVHTKPCSRCTDHPNTMYPLGYVD